jgi:hypothetical protein
MQSVLLSIWLVLAVLAPQNTSWVGDITIYDLLQPASAWLVDIGRR